MSTATKAKASSAHRSKFFAKAQQRARRILKEPEELMRLAQKAERKVLSFKSGPLAELLDTLKAFLRLIRAFAKGDYRKVSWESMVVIVGAVVYVVSPIDLIPDVIPVVGLLDDATVLTFALRMVHEEVEEFLEWETATGRGPKPSTKKG